MGMSGIEQRACEAAAAAPMLEQVQTWAAVNSGSRNLPGLTTMAGLLADAFSALPGQLELMPPDPVEIVDPSGAVRAVEHGAHLLLTVRPNAPVQLLFTGHYDTVFGADHPFQTMKWLDDGRLNGPGVADMKGGLSLMLAALKAVETTPATANLGYQVLSGLALFRRTDRARGAGQGGRLDL